MNVPTFVNAAWQARASRLWQTLQAWPWLDTVKTLLQRFREDRLGVTASSLTFTTIISLVPLVTVGLAVFSAFPIFGSFQKAVERYFLQALVPDSIAKPVLSTLTQFAMKANKLGSAGLVFLIISAIALMLTIDRSLNAIWRVRRARPLAQRVLMYWAGLTLGPLLLGLSLSLTSYAISSSRGLVGALPGGIEVLLDILEFAMFVGAMTLLFRFVPNTEVRWPHAFAGALFVGVGFQLAQRGLGWYLRRVPSYEIVYGAFATLPIFLVWLYLSWVIVLLGAVIAAYAPSLKMRIVRRPQGPGARFELAVSLLRTLALARGGRRHGLSVVELAESLRTDPLQIEPVLDQLVALDWVGRLDEGGAPRHVLLCDPAQTLAAPLLERTLLDAQPGLNAFWRRAGFGEMKLAEVLAP